jgi:hypothetical protein
MTYRYARNIIMIDFSRNLIIAQHIAPFQKCVTIYKTRGCYDIQVRTEHYYRFF